MTTDNTTQLTEFKTNGQPTSIDELTVGSPDGVLERFDGITPFANEVTINASEPVLLVGRTVNGERGMYHLYHDPTDPDHHGYAGMIGIQRYPDPSVIGFIPAGDDPDDETVVEPVTSLDVRSRDAFDELDAVINQLKTELTGEDWVETGRADTNWNDWNDAVLSLMRFYDDHYDNPSFTITHQFMKGATMHAIARYPSDASKLLSSASMRLNRLEDSEDSNRYHVTPFGVEQLLRDYADANVNIEPDGTRKCNETYE